MTAGEHFRGRTSRVRECGGRYTVANNEMAIWFKLHAGSWVPPHSGACNTQINIHMSLWGETDLRVRDTWHKMGPGDLVCFDDSYLHEASAAF